MFISGIRRDEKIIVTTKLDMSPINGPSSKACGTVLVSNESYILLELDRVWHNTHSTYPAGTEVGIPWHQVISFVFNVSQG